MSYILDALKKTEHEKNRKNRGDGIVNISGELFDEASQLRPAAKSNIKNLVVIAFVALVTFAVTIKFFSPEKPATVAVRPLPPSAPAKVGDLTSQQPAVPAAAPPAPTLLAPAPVPATPAKAVSPEPSQQVVHVNQQTVPKTRTVPLPSQPVVAKPLPALQKHQNAPAAAPTAGGTAVEVDAAALLTQQELHRRLKDRKGAVMPLLPSMAPPADLKLSGIAYQDERRARRAVVNGFLLQEGSQVSGTTITDIFQDRVRFSQGGRSFELGLMSVPGK